MNTMMNPACNKNGLRIGSLWLLFALAAIGIVMQNSALAQVLRLPPSIMTQPQSQTVSVGARVVLTVVATANVADGPLRYLWKKDGVNLSAQTGATLTIASATTADAGDYSVAVSNDLGTTASSIARLTVNSVQSPVIVITTQPASQTVSAGANVTFNVTATGSAPMSFQWTKNGVALAGQTSASLTLASVTSADAGNYAVTVSNATSVVTSAVVALTVTVPDAPLITLQPISQVVPAGTSVNFTVNATGSGQLGFQWKKNGVNLAGKTSATLTINAAAAADAGDYSVAVSNSSGVTTSQNATLVVVSDVSPKIAVQPLNQNVSPGSTVVFSVTATGSGNLAFQWRKNGVNLSGQTGATLTLNNVTSADAGDYSVVVSNSSGADTSATAKLTVTATAVQPPVILVQPITQTVPLGAKVNLSVTATGSGQLRYQWKKNGVDLAGQTAASLTINAAAAADAGDYGVTVSNDGGVTSSALASLTVGTTAGAPLITLQPVQQSVAAGATVTFTASAEGTGPLSFQWKKNGVNVAGGTSASLTLNNVTAADAGDYSVSVSNSAGVTSSSQASLTVGTTASVPKITVQPLQQSVAAGATVTLTANAEGTGPLSFQWKKNGVNISGATSASLTLNGVSAADAGDYSVVVSNSAGTATSTAATLTVNAAGAPAIVAQPSGQTATAGSKVTLAVQATGSGTLSYQWKLNGVNIAGATQATLTLDNVQVSNAGKYQVVISNSTGATTSAEATLNVVAQSSSGGSVDTSFLNGAVSNLTAIAVQADGKVVVAGGFTSIAGVPRNRIARLNADGSLDASFGAGAGANGTVRDVQLQGDGKVLIAGEFTNVDGAGRNRLARLNADGSIDASFNSSANAAVNTMAIQSSDGKIVIGGEFTSVNGLARSSVARLNVDGSTDTSFGASGGPNGTVADVAVQTDGKILIGGAFTNVQGVSRGGLARLNADGSVDASFGAGIGAGTNGTVNEVELQTNGKILLAGSFATVNGLPRLNLARLNADGSLDLSFDSGLAAGGNITSLRVQSDGKILTGGQLSLTSGGGSLTRLNADGSLDIGFQATSLNLGPVADIEIQGDGKIVIGGGSAVTRLVSGLALQVPRVLNFVRTQGAVQLSVSTEVGKTYVLETQTSITASTWNELSTAVGDGSVKSFTDASATDSVRFYRIRVK
jgi:uncharacterized delta-60 repeat protein